MAGPEINIGANVEGAEQAVKQLTDQINNMGREAAAANHTKFRLVSPEEIGDAKRLAELWQQISRTQRGLRTAVSASGQKPDNLFNIDFEKIALTHTQQRSMIMRFLQGTSAYEGQFQRPKPDQERPAPPHPGQRAPIPRPVRAVGEGLRTVGEGMGGLPGRMVGAGIRGGSRGYGRGMARAGAAAEGGEAAEGAGMAGGIARGAMGALGGAGIGAAIYGLFKAGSMAKSGMSQAREQDLSLDQLKMQMPGLNTSFRELSDAANQFRRGLLVNTREFTNLEREMNKFSGGIRHATNLAGETRTAVGFATGFGANYQQTVGFFGRERQMMGDNDSQMRRFSMMVGEAIVRSGLTAQSDRVMQAIEGYTERTSSESLTRPNVSGYAGMFTSLAQKNSGLAGMTPGVDARMLATANSAVSNMGAGGEGSKAFTLAAYNRQGRLNPIQAQILSNGGLFGTRAQQFGDESPWHKYMQAQGIGKNRLDAMQSRLLGQHSHETNMQSLMTEMDRFHVSPMLKASMIQQQFGFSSISQAMAFASVNPAQMGQVNSLLQRNDIDPKSVNASGIRRMATIASATNMQGLQSSITSLQNSGKMTKQDKDNLKQAESRGFKPTQDALAKIAAHVGRQQTTGSKMMRIQADISSKLTKYGEPIVRSLTTMELGIMKMAGVSSPAELIKSSMKVHRDAVHRQFSPMIESAQKKLQIDQKALDNAKQIASGSKDPNVGYHSNYHTTKRLIEQARENAKDQVKTLSAKVSSDSKHIASLKSTEQSNITSYNNSLRTRTGAHPVGGNSDQKSQHDKRPQKPEGAAAGTALRSTTKHEKRTVVHHHTHSVAFELKNQGGRTHLHLPQGQPLVFGSGEPTPAGDQ